MKLVAYKVEKFGDHRERRSFSKTSNKYDLKDDGELWFVMNKDHGAKSTIEKMKNVYDLTILEKKKGFFVISCKKR